MEKLLKVKDAADFLGLSKSTLYNLIKSRKIPFIRLTQKRVALKESELKLWLERRENVGQWTQGTL